VLAGHSIVVIFFVYNMQRITTAYVMEGVYADFMGMRGLRRYNDKGSSVVTTLIASPSVRGPWLCGCADVLPISLLISYDSEYGMFG
jgi:hypothetical protein